MSDVLEKSKAELTGEDRQTLADYIARYGPILERVNKALSSIEKKLKGVDPEDEYTPSIAEAVFGYETIEDCAKARRVVVFVSKR